jgi:two-component system, NarL family, sensor histidine kinase NreB
VTFAIVNPREDVVANSRTPVPGTLALFVSVSEGEHRRIADEIHDGSIQVMAAAAMRVQILRRSLSDPEQLGRLDQLERSIAASISGLRHLIFELAPPALGSEGLGGAIRDYVDGVSDAAATSFRLNDRLTVEPSAAARTILYRIAQEVLSNIRNPAHAFNATVTLEQRDNGFYMRIGGEGVGFGLNPRGDRRDQVGLAATGGRAELVGGWCRVGSHATGGTTVEAWIPDDEAVGTTSGPR